MATIGVAEIKGKFLRSFTLFRIICTEALSRLVGGVTKLKSVVVELFTYC